MYHPNTNVSKNKEIPENWLQLNHLVQRQHLLPTGLLLLAAFCIMISIFFPYWRMELDAPQYPEGLNITLYVNKVSGDIAEIDVLNHYIGMRPLEQAAVLERTLSIFAVLAMAFAVIGATFVHNKWAVLLTLPIIGYPFIFLADLYFWLMTFGQNLDPTAALSSSVEPFVQPIVGTKAIANFYSTGILDIGFYIACLAVFVVLLGLYFHRKMYKPFLISPQEAYEIQNLSMTKLQQAAKKDGIHSAQLMEYLRQKYCELCKKDQVDKFSFTNVIETARKDLYGKE